MAEFARMNWVREIGGRGHPLSGAATACSCGDRTVSGPIPQERIFAHVGWRQYDSRWLYLHAGGAIGSDGPVAGLRVQLPAALQTYELRAAADGAALRSAVRASLDCLTVAAERISLPLLAAVYRAPFGRAEFSLFLAGGTGRFKTALAALGQQHFGATMDAGNLPANFASTANGLGGLAFHAKDALLVVDDFAPRRMGGDEALQNIAERLFRGAGNQQGRNRMGGDGRLQTPQPPRGLLLATGEEVPQGASIRARLVIVEVEAGAVDRTALSRSQGAAREGRLVEAMAALWLGWGAGMKNCKAACASEYWSPEQQQEGAVHARLPGALAELQAGWEMFLQFGSEVGEVGSREREESERRVVKVLGEIGRLQAKYQEADVARRFLTLLRGALAGGLAHVANRRGGPPEEARALGLAARQRAGSRREIASVGWRATIFVPGLDGGLSGGRGIGWEGDVGVSEQALRHRLQLGGLLVSTDASRHMLPVRRMLEGRLKPVLHLKAAALVEGRKMSGLSG